MNPAPPQRLDPHTVPAYRVDVGWPAVPPQRVNPQFLRERFAANVLWQPELRQEPAYLQRPLAPAAVLMALVGRPEPTLLLTQRTWGLSTHAGQIALPGGRVDAADADATAAALREAWEEVGLPPSAAQVLGCLPSYRTGSAFDVTPVVAWVDALPALQPNPQEVQAVFEVPLRHILDPANHRHHRTVWQGVERHWLSMPYHDGVQERFIWGVTAAMLRNLYRFWVA